MTDNPEPAQRLYDTIRDMGLLTAAWEPWESLSPEMQGDLRRAAAGLLTPENAPVVAESVCCHRWHCAAFRQEEGWFFCSRFLEVRRVPVHGL